MKSIKKGEKKSPLKSLNDSGQVTIMVALMITTFLLFFQFVVNTGVLVNAKINLQNAADMAAYSGAATQARQLNDISFLNYEMRRQFKKFLFRYYVLGNMAQKSQPVVGVDKDDTSDPFQSKRSFRPTHQDEDRRKYNVPATCVIFDSDDNYCQIKAAPEIPSVGEAFSGDRISAEVGNQLRKLEGIRQQHCKLVGITNQLVNQLWLFNTDPDLKAVEAAFKKRSEDNDFFRKKTIALQTVKNFATGLGLIPKWIMLAQRIKNLEDYVNAEAVQGLDIKGVKDLERQRENRKVERSIQAFLSAYYTLGNHSFDSNSIKLDEVLPRGGSGGSNLLKLEEVKTQFNTYFIDMAPKQADLAQGKSDCVAEPTQVKVGRVTAGFYKDPSAMTYYAVKLSARVKTMLFNPFGNELVLTAFSAAKPFGSRIGPRFNNVDDLDNPPFMAPGKKPPGCDDSDRCKYGVPNMRIYEGDSLSHGWYSAYMIAETFKMLKKDGNFDVTNPQKEPLQDEDIKRAYQAAMVPYQWEKGRYNIPNDLGEDEADPFHSEKGDPMIKFFTRGNKRSYAIWAPVVPADASAEEAKDELQQKIQAAIPEPTLARELAEGIGEYFTDIRDGQGEDGEGRNVYRINDPMYFRESSGEGITLITFKSEVMLRNKDDMRSSWSGLVTSSRTQRSKRVGYSVKFISFDTLLNPGDIRANNFNSGDGQIRNRLEPGPGDANDIAEITH